MALFSIKNISFDGLACSIPKNKEYNKDYPYHTDLENKQFIQTTGIEERRVVNDNTTSSDLCLIAAEKLLKKLCWKKSEVTILIFITQTPDYKIPSTAPILQDKLGLSTHCIAFDINLGCSGYVYGLSIVSSLLEKTKGKALLLVGDVSSSVINRKDKTVAPLFSDAGSCTALSYNVAAKKMYFNLQTDGKDFKAINIKDGGMKSPTTIQSFVFNEKTSRTGLDMELKGIKVFNFSRKEVFPNIENLLEKNQLAKNQIDYFVLHQANLFMNEHIRKKLMLEKEKMPYSLKTLGNTSSASIPITLINNLRDKLEEKPLKMVFSGFGVGLSWGSIYIQTKKVITLPLIEV